MSCTLLYLISLNCLPKAVKSNYCCWDSCWQEAVKYRFTWQTSRPQLNRRVRFFLHCCAVTKGGGKYTERGFLKAFELKFLQLHVLSRGKVTEKTLRLKGRHAFGFFGTSHLGCYHRLGCEAPACRTSCTVSHLSGVKSADKAAYAPHHLGFTQTAPFEEQCLNPHHSELCEVTHHMKIN